MFSFKATGLPFRLVKIIDPTFYFRKIFRKIAQIFFK